MITLDFSKRQSLKVWAKEYDTARELNVQCIKDYVPIDITNCIITLNALKKDGTYIYNNGEIQDATNGKVTFPMTNQLLAVVGEVKADVSIYYPNGTILTSSSFTFDIDETIRNDEAIESSSEFTELTKAILAESNRVLAENGRVSAEQTRVNNETARCNAENDRISAENGRVTAENNRVSAETARVNAETLRVEAEDSRATAETARQTGYSQMLEQINQLNETNVNLSTQLANLAGFVGYTEDDIYGVEVDFANRTFTRLAGAVGKTPGADFDSILAFGGRRRCNLADNGTVNAYYGDPGYIEDGSNGQVMVEQPKFYYKVVPLQLEKIQDGKGYHMRKARYYVSDTPKVGFKVHPAFVRNGVEVDKIYLSAYEGSIYDVSATAYLLADEQIADFNEDKLSSIAYAKPASGLTQNLTRSNTRKLANNRGTGWEQAFAATVAATQLLFAIEYASFNTQTKIGMGNVSKTDDNTTNMSELTGATTHLGNQSGSVTNENGINIVTYRGEENFWGNIWAWVDGINVYIDPETRKTDAYVADHGFTDDVKAEPYKDVGFSLASYSSGSYISAFGYNEEFDYLFLTSEVLVNSALPVGDAFYNTQTGWKVAQLGGSWSVSSAAGAFYWDVHNAPSIPYRYIGGRLVYVP